MSRRALVVLFLVFAVGGGVVNALIAERQGAPAVDDRVSASSTAPRGARALWLWLRELGYPTRSWRRPLGALEEPEALCVLEPSQAVTPDGASALLDWVARGGVLFLAPGADSALSAAVERWVTLEYDMSEASTVRGDRVVPGRDERWRYREARPEERGLFAYPVEEVAVAGGARVRDERGEHSILFARDGAGLVAEIYHGDGVLVVFPEADLLTNEGLPRASNAELVASLVEDWIPPGTEIWFDEYDHGGRVAGSAGAYLAARRPGLFTLAALAAGALAVLRWRRALVVRAEESASRRRRPTEYVDALGALYARAKAVGPAWAALSEAAQRIARGELAGLRATRSAELDAALAPAARAPAERELVTLATAVARALGRREERT
ncbi:MAG: DUF4350 domain-containing protein [Candidatus Eiseniibacteriota bacterium]